MNAAKKALARTQEFVTTHKTAITVTVTAAATAAVCIAVQRSAVRDWNAFLAERGLTEEFYTHLDPNN